MTTIAMLDESQSWQNLLKDGFYSQRKFSTSQPIKLSLNSQKRTEFVKWEVVAYLAQVISTGNVGQSQLIIFKSL